MGAGSVNTTDSLTVMGRGRPCVQLRVYNPAGKNFGSDPEKRKPNEKVGTCWIRIF